MCHWIPLQAIADELLQKETNADCYNKVRQCNINYILGGIFLRFDYNILFIAPFSVVGKPKNHHQRVLEGGRGGNRLTRGRNISLQRVCHPIFPPVLCFLGSYIRRVEGLVLYMPVKQLIMQEKQYFLKGWEGNS